METSTDIDLPALLRSHGHRVTRPRRAVWEVLRGSDEHLTVEQVADRVTAAGHDVDLASVYRTLGLLEELGLARVSRLGERDAGTWERAHPDEHFHLVCGTCGDVEHHIGSLVAQIRSHLTDGHGFAVDEVELTVTGTCVRCQHG